MFVPGVGIGVTVWTGTGVVSKGFFVTSGTGVVSIGFFVTSGAGVVSEGFSVISGAGVADSAGGFSGTIISLSSLCLLEFPCLSHA